MGIADLLGPLFVTFLPETANHGLNRSGFKVSEIFCRRCIAEKKAA
jgi:hypothetical protein